MYTLTVVALACLAVFASAKPSGHGVVVSGPSGIVTGHGAIGPVGVGHGGHGGWDDGSWDGAWGAHSNVVHGNGATLIGAGAGHAVLAGPVVGHGGWGGLGGWGGHGAWGGLGWAGAGWAGHGHGGVVVKGPPTAPVAVVGPGATGKIVADGLWGPTHAGLHGGHGGHWGGHW